MATPTPSHLISLRASINFILFKNMYKLIVRGNSMLVRLIRRYRKDETSVKGRKNWEISNILIDNKDVS